MPLLSLLLQARTWVGLGRRSSQAVAFELELDRSTPWRGPAWNEQGDAAALSAGVRGNRAARSSSCIAKSSSKSTAQRLECRFVVPAQTRQFSVAA